MLILFNDLEEILTTEELAEVLCIGKNAVYQLLVSGGIKAFRIGRTWKIPRASVSEYIKRKCGFLAR